MGNLGYSSYPTVVVLTVSHKMFHSFRLLVQEPTTQQGLEYSPKIIQFRHHPPVPELAHIYSQVTCALEGFDIKPEKD